MAIADVDGAAAVFLQAIIAVRDRYHHPGTVGASELAEARARLASRIAYMLGTDPGGAWVAVAEDRVVGLSQAVRRDGLWVLSLLGVAVHHQDGGVGKALLGHALDYGGPGEPGLVFSSPDPRAMRRYLRAGFALHPSVVASGPLRPESTAPQPGVRPGEEGDRALVDAIDRHLRGSAHGPDVDYLLERGGRLLVVDERAYALVAGTRLAVLGALDEDAARAALRAALGAMAEAAAASAPDVSTIAPAGAPAPPSFDVEWLTAGQQWAFEVCAEAGMELHPVGAVMVRGVPGPLSPYVPSGGFG